MTVLRDFLLFLAFATLVTCDSRINFVFFHSQGISEYSIANLHLILSHNGFKNNRGTVLFHYGSGQNVVTPEVNEVIQAYRAINKYNFVVVHYPDSNDIGALNAASLGDAIGDSLINLFNRNNNPGFMHLVGFSIGAQIMGRASRRVQERSRRQHIIGHVIGLDPFDLGVVTSRTVGRMSPGDAQLVETIHTEGSNRGDHESRGHVSFMVNGGVHQPFCDHTLPSVRADCNHIFALRVWAESVRSEAPTFPALYCSSWTRYLGGECNENNVIHVGKAPSNLRLRGTYFLRTNHQSPFSRRTALP